MRCRRRRFSCDDICGSYRETNDVKQRCTRKRKWPKLRCECVSAALEGASHTQRWIDAVAALRCCSLQSLSATGVRCTCSSHIWVDWSNRSTTAPLSRVQRTVASRYDVTVTSRFSVCTRASTSGNHWVGGVATLWPMAGPRPGRRRCRRVGISSGIVQLLFLLSLFLQVSALFSVWYSRCRWQCRRPRPGRQPRL